MGVVHYLPGLHHPHFLVQANGKPDAVRSEDAGAAAENAGNSG